MDKALSPLASRVVLFGAQEELFTCKNIIIGLSGGPDSVALIALLHEISECREDFPSLHAIHINHNIRQEAKEDEELSRRLAADYEVPFAVYSEDVLELASKLKRSVEDTGRIVRYKAFRSYIEENKLQDAVIAVAHHKDDLAETVMLNLYRGSGLEGLVSPLPKAGDIIRPLLCLRKAELAEYLKEKKLSFAVDATNLDSDYTRNAWRNKIFPLIGEHSVKDPIEAVNDTYELLKDDLAYLEEAADKAYEEARIYKHGHPFLKEAKTNSLPAAIKSRVLRLLWNEIFSSLTDFSGKNTKDCMNTAAANTRLAMPFGRVFAKAGGFMTFCEEQEYEGKMKDIACLMGFIVSSEGSRISLDTGCSKTANLPNSDIQIKCEIIENNVDIAYNNMSWFYPLADGDETFDAILCNGSLTRRFRRAGSDSSKPLGRLLMSLHVPKEARSSVMYLELSGEIVWIPGIGASCGIVSEKAYKAWTEANGGIEPTRFLKVSVCCVEGKEEYGSV